MLSGNKRKEEKHYLTSAINGEREGFEYLVSTYQKLAYSLAVKICGNQQDAEEVVQDAFIKAFRALADFRSAAKFSTWLYKIVYHTALTKKNVKKIQGVELNENSGSEIELGLDQAAFKHLAGADRRHYIDLALSRLVEEEKAVITLHYLGEQSTSEIADILGIGKSAVKMRLVRGRQKLEAALKDLLGNEIKNL